MAESMDNVRWLETWTDDGTNTFRIGRADDELVAEWAGMATLRANRSGSVIDFSFAAGCDPDWAKKVQNGQAAALVRHLRGGVTLHASGVVMEGVGLLFLGESGSGKSTLAADLCLHEGCALLGDDTAALGLGESSVAVAATESVSWLTRQSRNALGQSEQSNGKRPIRPQTTAPDGAPLGLMVKLTFDETAAECRAVRLNGGATFDILSRSLFRFVVDEPKTTIEDFERLARLATLAPMYELRRPRSFAALNRSRETLKILCRRRIHEAARAPDHSRNI